MCPSFSWKEIWNFEKAKLGSYTILNSSKNIINYGGVRTHHPPIETRGWKNLVLRPLGYNLTHHRPMSILLYKLIKWPLKYIFFRSVSIQLESGRQLFFHVFSKCLISPNVNVIWHNSLNHWERIVFCSHLLILSRRGRFFAVIFPPYAVLCTSSLRHIISIWFYVV